MQYLMIAAAVLCGAGSKYFQKHYTVKTEKINASLFVSITCFIAALCFAVANGFSFEYKPPLIIYSVSFAAFYAMGWIGTLKAFETGSVAATGLVVSSSVTVPLVFGLFYFGEEPSVFATVGLALLLCAIILVNSKGKQMKFSKKWLVFAVCAFFGNGMCSVIQKLHQTQFVGGQKSEFMIIAMLLVGVALLPVALFKKAAKQDFKCCIKYSVGNGICNSFLNMLVLRLTSITPSVILFSSLSAGGIVAGCVLAVAFFKERLSKKQILGYLLGTAALVLLNIK